jgi:GPH family glycoside/pentoside/hexuronide:cation symporter
VKRGERNADRLGRQSLIGIATGDFGLALYWQTASLYLLYFYTDVLHISPAVSGAIYMGALVWDATIDPAIGAFADSTRSKLGRYRPYVLFGSPLLAIAFLSLFLLPAYGHGLVVTMAIVTLPLFRTCYAIVSVPYAAFSAYLTRHSDERTRLTVVRLMFGTAGGVAVALTALPVGEAMRTNAQPVLGWLLVSGCFAVIATFALLIGARASREYDLPSVTKAPGPGVAQKLRATAANGPFLILLAAIIVTSCSSTIFNKNLVYYFKYGLHDARLASLALSFMSIVVGCSVPVWGFVATRFSKRAAWLAGLIPTLLGLLLWWLVDGKSTALVFVGLALIALGNGAALTSYWAMLPDTVEFGEWRRGVRCESFGYGLVAFGQKVAFGAGGGLVGLLLAKIGYVADVTQSASTLAALKAIVFLTPLSGALLAGALISFYPLSRKLHRQMVAEIAERSSQDTGHSGRTPQAELAEI